MNDQRQLKILIADDTDTDRLILETIVRREGHSIVSASNGQQAVDLFISESPDMVLLDALMPIMDGFEAARLIKDYTGDKFIPILFLTSLTDNESLVKCLDAGGDDFMSKPYSRIVLQAKIKSFNRMREMNATVLIQRDEIAKNNARLLQEQMVAKHVFDNVAHSGCLNSKNIRYFLSSLAVFNGDMLLAAMRPNGNMIVLLGDFTGHGLPAAIGAMPVASTFYGMIPKGFSMTDVLKEINNKLKQILPVGIFCCASMLDINFRKKKLTIWNGGLPAGFLYRINDHSIHPIKSTHLPLGVLSPRAFKDNCEEYDLVNGDRLYLWSDGIHEARNTTGEMFGETRLMDVFHRNTDSETLFDDIISNVQAFIGDSEKDDDISLFEIRMADPVDVNEYAYETSTKKVGSAIAWDLSFEVKPTSFKVFDPLPVLINVIMEIPSLRPYNAALYTILAELYANALEHGVLGLDSALKKSPEGFSEYYELRNTRIQNITEGYVKIYISYFTEDINGRLIIRVEDSGKGFDYQKKLGANLSTSGYSGRGIALMEKMCESVRYEGKGNIAEVVFVWANDD
jgi:two-component system, HptB-dependent secretion and biofilm response regulator